MLYDQRVDLNNRQPVLQKGGVRGDPARPPTSRFFDECQHFLDCVRSRKTPLSDAASGIDVLRVLQACQTSLQLNGRPVVVRESSEPRVRLSPATSRVGNERGET